MGHLISRCTILAQKEYKRKCDNVARIVHWTVCGKYGLEGAAHWYDHTRKGVVDSDDIKV